jgi:YjgF/chorismate_mutase-like putative endoribonuclease
MSVEKRLTAIGLALPGAMRFPPGLRANWRQVRVVGSRAIIAGHGPRAADGTPYGKPGKVGRDLSIEEGYEAAKATGLAILGDLKRELGDLDRIVSWSRVFGMVNSAPGFIGQAAVIDGFTDLMIALFGDEAAICPRAVMGAAELAMNSPVIIEAEVEVAPRRESA